MPFLTHYLISVKKVKNLNLNNRNVVFCLTCHLPRCTPLLLKPQIHQDSLKASSAHEYCPTTMSHNHHVHNYSPDKQQGAEASLDPQPTWEAKQDSLILTYSGEQKMHILRREGERTHLTSES